MNPALHLLLTPSNHALLSTLFLAIVLTSIPPAHAADRTIGVFVALADNHHQGIVPVPAAIGNGDDPEKNLYWGTADGLKSVFARSAAWKLTAQSNHSAENVLRTLTYRNPRANAVLGAKAYRGAAIKACLQDFESAIQTGAYDLVVFIGHNGLMDFELPVPRRTKSAPRRPDCIVLCCRSAAYFEERIAVAGGRPILLTTQLMYPGAFILEAVTNDWLAGKDRPALRASAGRAYARNQGLTEKAGMGIFAQLEK